MTAQSDSHSLSASLRSVVGKQVRQLRTQGLIPAVVYGHKQETTAISLSEREFVKLYKAAGNATLLDLAIDGHTSHKVLVHDVQYHPTRGHILHADFYQVNMREKLQTEIPLELVGESPAVETEGGSLITVKGEIEVECLPSDLIPHIEVDISKLATFDDVIRVSDLIVPKGITILTDGEEMLLSITAPRSEEEMAELDEALEDTTPEVESETGNTADATEEGEEKS